jgi:hypothetical protein
VAELRERAAAGERTAALAAEVGKQSREVNDQAEMLGLQRKQLAEAEKTSAKQAEVLELQAKELCESLDERKREAEDKRRAQAAQVTAWFAWAPVTGDMYLSSDWGATVRNASNLPVVDVRVTFNYIAERANGMEWDATPGSHERTLCYLPQITPYIRRQPPRPVTAATAFAVRRFGLP